MEHNISSEVNERIKADIRTLVAFAGRIRELEEDTKSSTGDLLKAIQAAYGLLKLVIFDERVIISSDKIVHDFIHKFIDSVEDHISLLQDRYCASLLVKTNHPD